MERICQLRQYACFWRTAKVKTNSSLLLFVFLFVFLFRIAKHWQPLDPEILARQLCSDKRIESCEQVAFRGVNFCGSPVQSFEFALFAKVHFEFHSAINRQIRIGNSSHRSKVLCAANPSVCWILCSRASNEPLMSSIAESKFT